MSRQISASLDGNEWNAYLLQIFMLPQKVTLLPLYSTGNCGRMLAKQEQFLSTGAQFLLPLLIVAVR